MRHLPHRVALFRHTWRPAVPDLTDRTGDVVERYQLAPYGQLAVNQETGYGDHDGDGDGDQ